MTHTVHTTDTDDDGKEIPVTCYFSIIDEEDEKGKSAYYQVQKITAGDTTHPSLEDFEAVNPDIAKEVESLLDDELESYDNRSEWDEDYETDD